MNLQQLTILHTLDSSATRLKVSEVTYSLYKILGHPRLGRLPVPYYRNSRYSETPFLQNVLQHSVTPLSSYRLDQVLTTL